MTISGGSLNLSNLEVKYNVSNNVGGGMNLENTNCSISNTLIYNNFSENGAGMHVQNLNNEGYNILNSIIVGNIASSNGGGIQLRYCNITFTNTSILHNSANSGGAIYLKEGTNAIFSNNSIWENISQNVNGIHLDPNDDPITLGISNTNIYNNGYSILNENIQEMVTALNNYWGHSSGPYHPSQNPTGQGDSTNAFVNVTPWLTAPDTDAPPIPIQNLAVTATGDEFISIEWEASPIGDLAGYNVYYNVDSTDFMYSYSTDAGIDTEYTVLPSSGEWTLTLDVSSLSTVEGLSIPDNFALHQNYPNPFNPVTTLHYDLPEQSLVSIMIYDILGREIIELVHTVQDAGFKSIQWDATNDSGNPVNAGVYIYQIHAGDFVQIRKMVLLK